LLNFEVPLYDSVGKRLRKTSYFCCKTGSGRFLMAVARNRMFTLM